MRTINPFMPLLSQETPGAPRRSTRLLFSASDEEILEIVRTLNAMAQAASLNPVVRDAAENIVSPQRDNDQFGWAVRLTNWVRRHVIYMGDPFIMETYKTPVAMLDEIMRRGVATGDCDEHVLLYAALALSIGLPVRIVAVQSQPGGRFDHVIAETRINGQWHQSDLIAKDGQQREYPIRLL